MLETLIERTASRLEACYGAGQVDETMRYVGPLGVDVLGAREGWLPYVEINLRRTMGHVALAVGARFSPDRPPRLLRVADDGLHLDEWDEA